ncbi:MAG: hypothetical protein ACWGQW_02400 [bacterium]
MALGLATKGVICLGGGGGSGYPEYIYIDRVGDVSAAIEIEEDVLVTIAMEDENFDIVLGDDQEASIAIEGDQDAVISISDDDLDVAIELETKAEIWPWYQPRSMTVDYGTLSCGGLAVLYAADSNVMVVDEIPALTPGFNIEFTFVTVPEGSKTLNIVGYYEGNPAHNVKAYIYNYNTTNWEAFTVASTDFPSTSSLQTYQFTMPSPYSNYMSGSQMRVRIRHINAGSAGHYFYLDHVYLG